MHVGIVLSQHGSPHSQQVLKLSLTDLYRSFIYYAFNQDLKKITSIKTNQECITDQVNVAIRIKMTCFHVILTELRVSLACHRLVT